MIFDFENLRALQWHQHRHDMDYHADVAAMPPALRMKHFSLHMAKYAAYLAESEESGDKGKLDRALVDSLAIILAIANTLGQDLGRDLRAQAGGVSSKSADGLDVVPQGMMWRFFVREVGALSKACEALDHLEDFPFKKTMKEANGELARIVLSSAAGVGLDIEGQYKTRLRDVEKRSMFDDFIQAGRMGADG
ncbi:hypothetical protein MTR62_13525 [Novosphingobium sp. 1949]|uniref:Uncharacterized protein n=1 Tax=Novosphingobium organovorum TaxID=2930092 RepID=A0ABT0BF63_9SPHN|nr:hypothetical protein [Novosphingobium organovorum]MCJ2183702.1 hypothetical protein [Novosphingobium organovorum]